MARTKVSPIEDVAPDQRKLTDIQVHRLAGLADLDPKVLAGQNIAQIAEKLKWHLDPELLLFRRICGRVVKKDPVTGTEYPVPFATVLVEDTDCHLLAYFPDPWPWGWFFPLWCHREVIGQTTTDRCGRFCVWVPRFDIDWILQWRRLRLCYRQIFLRPSIRDLLRVEPVVRKPFPPPPPDGDPIEEIVGLPPTLISALAGPAAPRVTARLAQLEGLRAAGAPATGMEALADERAFDTEIPPPLPQEFQRVLHGQEDVTARKRVDATEAIRSAVGLHVGLAPKELERLDLSRFIGPFWRCFDVWLPVWQRILDVPDITFRVTQDVDGDGTEENIYSEGFFDVRWNAGAIPDVKLVASPLAKESHLCDTPSVPCGDKPAILFAGLMPLTDAAYYDAALGYTLRPNRPKPVGPRPAAQTPFLWTLQLYGCVNIKGASFYRVLQSADDGASFAAITGLHWNLYPIPSGPPLTVSADSAGWYDVLTNPDDYHPARMVLEWPTPPLGKYLLKIELGNATKHKVGESPTVAFQVDNTAPAVVFTTLKWKFSSEPEGSFDLPGRSLLVTCPTIRRGAAPHDVDVQYEVSVSAHHLRDGSIYALGCDGTALPLQALPAPHTAHWHETVADNSVLLSGRYTISAAKLEGAYRFGCRANGRAMNPAGGDGGHLADWWYDPIYAWVQPEIAVAVVNA